MLSWRLSMEICLLKMGNGGYSKTESVDDCTNVSEYMMERIFFTKTPGFVLHYTSRSV